MRSAEAGRPRAGRPRDASPTRRRSLTERSKISVGWLTGSTRASWPTAGSARRSKSYARRSRCRSGRTVPTERLRPDLELVAYFMCSEALTNIVKHADASRTAVSVTVVDEHVMIRVEDDGLGGPTPTRGPVCVDSPTGSRPSGGHSGWTVSPEGGRASPPSSRSAVRRASRPRLLILVQTWEKHWNASPGSMSGAGVRVRFPSESAENVTSEA